MNIIDKMPRTILINKIIIDVDNCSVEDKIKVLNKIQKELHVHFVSPNEEVVNNFHVGIIYLTNLMGEDNMQGMLQHGNKKNYLHQIKIKDEEYMEYKVYQYKDILNAELKWSNL